MLEHHGPAIAYPIHSWGPEEQDLLIPDEDHWHDPEPDTRCGPDLGRANMARTGTARLE